jgi:hypothetical protein
MKSLMKFAVGGALLALAGLSNATLLDGKTLRFQYFGPDLASPVSLVYNGDVVVGPGVELVDPTGSVDASVDFSDTQIKLSFIDSGVEDSGTFVGVRLRDVLGQIDPFTSLSVNPSSTALGFAQSRLSLNENNLFLNLAGFSYTEGTQLLLDINAAPIPEPETYALMLAGLAVLGATVRRRKSS